MSNKKRHVFISHTAELSQWPKGRSVVDVVKDAIRKAGCSCSEMHDWTADTQPPKNVIEQRLGANDLMAVVHIGGRVEDSQEFTSNKRLLQASVDTFIGRDQFGDGEMKPRERKAPGAYYEYNDVRINRLSLSLLRVFGKVRCRLNDDEQKVCDYDDRGGVQPPSRYTLEVPAGPGWRTIGNALHGARAVLLLGHGNGKANASHLLVAYLEKHESDVASLVVADVRADIDDLADPAKVGTNSVGMITSEMPDLVMINLGIDPGPSGPDEWREAAAWLLHQRESGTVRKYYDQGYVDDFTAGNLAATLAWSGDVIYYNVWGGYPNLQFVFPEGGALIWVDNLMIPASATNPVGAIQLMDWVYQPEIAQGSLQALFEFQTQVALLTGMDVANASMYDGSTACAEAVLMAHRVTRRHKAVISGGVHPHYVKATETVVHAVVAGFARALPRRGRAPHTTPSQTAPACG